MNPRERALAALDHREPDRVPIDLGSTIATTITRTAYDALLRHLGHPADPQPRISHRQMDTVYPREDLLQRSATKMDIARLKREFGRDLCFWGGGIDVQQVLPSASPQQIRDEVRRTLDLMAPGGGYVFVASHNIQADVTSERIDALYQAAPEYT